MSVPEVGPPPKSKRRTTIPLLVLLVFIVTLAAVATNAALDRVVANGDNIEHSILRLQTLAYHLDALEWQAIGSLEVSPQLLEETNGTRDGFNRELATLTQLDPNSKNLQSVRQNGALFIFAVAQELRLLAAGNIDQAALLDLEQVDPASEVLNQALVSAGAMYEAQGLQAGQVANVGSAVVPFLATIAIGLLFWRVQKVQAASEAAGVKQKALAGSNESFLALNEMGNWLQACQTVAEAYDVICNFGQRLFPHESGALYVFNSSRNIIELASTWGKFPIQSPEPVLLPDECWALRRGQTYMVADTTSHEVLCQHLGQPKPDSYLCVP